MVRFWLTLIWCSPLCLLTFAWICALIGKAIGAPGWLIAIPGTPALISYYLMPTVWFIVYLLAAQSLLVAAWWYPAPLSRRVWLGALNALVLLYAAYDVWWYLTGQKWEYI